MGQTGMSDMFRPKSEPEVSIYDALVAEQQHRQRSGYPGWIENERRAVFNAAISTARSMGLRVPLFEEILSAERLAEGHVDYTRKFALGVAQAMKLGKA
jgi:hypothetical protein